MDIGLRTRGKRAISSFGLLLALSLAGSLLTGCKYELPDVSLDGLSPAQTSYVYAADGSLITTLHATENRDVVSLDKIPQALRDATVAIEDERFWGHDGVDVYGIGRAVVENSTSGSSQGASTITQQLVKNKILNDQHSLNRKIKEAVLAISIERKYSKERILEEYLNTIYLGGGAYGVEAASKRYFGVSVDKINVQQAALLAAIIRSPNAYDPVAHPQAAKTRRDVVLRRMVEQNYLTNEQVEGLKLAPLGLAPAEVVTDTYVAPFFVESAKRFVLSSTEFGEALSQRGIPNDENVRRDLLFRGGLRIYTTLDRTIQRSTEEAVRSTMPKTKSPDAAVVVLDPKSGEVKATYGGSDFFGTDQQAKFDLATQGRRQAGSAFKPFILAAALEKGIPLSKTYPAPSQLTIPIPGQQPWIVNNAEPGNNASMNLLEATAESVNTVFAQLMVDVTPQVGMEMATRLGITSPLSPVMASVLGTNSVSPLEMASAYATFANRGLHIQPTFISKITTPDGDVLYEHDKTPRRLLDQGVADTVNYAMQRVVSQGTASAARLSGREVAGKTGTATQFRDAWFVGYTPQLVTASWVGFAQGQLEMKPPRTPIAVYGGTYPARIFNKTMASALAGTEPEKFIDPPSEMLSNLSRTPTLLPSVVGKSSAEAVSILSSLGLSVTQSTVRTFAVPTGNVASQSPNAGTPLVSGSSVTIGVADSTGLKRAPDLIGLNQKEATARVRALNLKVKVVIESRTTGNIEAGRVWKQTPEPEYGVEPDSEITVFVNPPRTNQTTTSTIEFRN